MNPSQAESRRASTLTAAVYPMVIPAIQERYGGGPRNLGSCVTIAFQQPVIPSPPVIPAKAGTQAIVYTTHQPSLP